MDFYYLVKSVELNLRSRKLRIDAPPSYVLTKKVLPIDFVRCGFVAWEVIQAREQCGEDAVVLLPPHPEVLKFLPERIKPFHVEGCLIRQLTSIRQRKEARGDSHALKLALINGFGTMVGDNLIGVSALNEALAIYKSESSANVQAYAYLAWNAVDGTYETLSNSGLFESVQFGSATLGELKEFDAYWDFSSLLLMDGYNSENFFDFYLNHLGIDPSRVPPTKKNPTIPMVPSDLGNLSKLFANKESQPVIFLQAKASTVARSIPKLTAQKLLNTLLRRTNATVIYSQEDDIAVECDHIGRAKNLWDITNGDLNKYLFIVSQASLVIAVDTLALHIAMGKNLPGIGLFVLSSPGARLKYSETIEGFLIPDADTLPYWGKHKADSLWETARPMYEQAWEKLDLQEVSDTLTRMVRPTKSSSSKRTQ